MDETSATLPAVQKSALAVRHVHFEDLGYFESALHDRGYVVQYREAGRDPLSEADFLQTDLLIVLGGPIAVYEGQTYPCVARELELIRARLAAERPLLGICLGAQLIAGALGARVYRGPRKEIGWAQVTLTEAGKRSCLAAFRGVPVLHWHGDTFDLPAGASLLASSPAYDHQAFAYGSRVLALQFHVEAGLLASEQWLIGHACELAAADVDLARLRRDWAAHAPRLEAACIAMLDEWLGGFAQ